MFTGPTLAFYIPSVAALSGYGGFMILNETLIIGSLIAGGGFIVLLGYLFHLSVEPTQSVTRKKASPPVTMSKPFLGIFSTALGLIMLLAWGYLLYTGFNSLMSNFRVYLPHVTLELISGLGFVFSGLLLLKNSKYGTHGFLGSSSAFLLSTIGALLEHGMDNHPMLMNGVAIFVSVILIYFVGLVYSWSHVIIHWEERPESLRPAKLRRNHARSS